MKKRFGVENHRYRANMRMKLKASSCFFHVWLVVMAEKKKKGKLTVSGVTLHIGLHFYNNGYYTANSGPQKRC